jgi:hypothetical protein
MLKSEYTTVRPLLLCELADPKYRYWLRHFAGEIATPCVAESLMALLNRHVPVMTNTVVM